MDDERIVSLQVDLFGVRTCSCRISPCEIPKQHYSTTLNFVVLPLVEVDHVTR